ncbi:MAG: methyltransferase [Methanomassiliicoccales archaeon]
MGDAEISYWSDEVYFPAEDSMLLIDAIEPGKGSFLDVGTGSGIAGIIASRRGYSVVSTDISSSALRCAALNAVANNVEIRTVRCDLLSGLRGDFDVIAFNPPYLPSTGASDYRFEGGKEGWELSARFLNECEGRITAEGYVLLIVSSLTSQGVLRSAGNRWIFEERGMRNVGMETLRVLRAKPSSSLSHR